MTASGIWAAVPVKSLRHAKQRLSPALVPHQRRRLVLSMLDDVLDALSGVPTLQGIMVISPDRDVLAAAAHAGVVCVPQFGDIGLSVTANEAARLAATLYSAAAIMIVPADLPLAKAGDFSAIIARHRAPGCTLAPSSDGGTNCILLSPPGAMGFLFGPDSARRHVQGASALGLMVQTHDCPRLAADIDEPDDLARVQGKQSFLEKTDLEKTDQTGASPLTDQTGASPFVETPVVVWRQPVSVGLKADS